MATLLALWLTLAAATTPQAPTPQASTPHGVVPDPAGPQAAPAAGPHDTLALQVLLDRVGFSPGEIDGKPGRNLERALRAFQAANGLPTSGQPDQLTWMKLSEVTGQPATLVAYTVTDADVQGPFTPRIPRDLMAQAKLDALGYRDPLESLAEKFHASPALLKAMNAGADFAKAGQQVWVPNVVVTEAPAVTGSAGPSRGGTRSGGPSGAPEQGGRASAARGGGASGPAGAAPMTPDKPAVVVTVSKETSSLTVEDESGKVILHAPVTSGSEHDPLPIGTWKVNGVQQHPRFHYNPKLFWDADPKHSKATLAPGPNNPVGTVWIDINKPHYGIHGTPEPGKIGHVESHGCVRLTNWDAQRVAALVKPGTKVIFR